MGAFCGPMGAILQSKIDQKHSDDLFGHSKNIAQINYELRHVIQDLKSEFTQKVNDPDQDWPCDLSEFVEKFGKLREIHQKFMDAGPAQAGDAEDAEIPDLFSGDLGAISKADLEKLLRKIEDIETSHKDTVSDTTQQLYLLGQLFITITDIVRKMDEGNRKYMERLAERIGMR